jgi:Transposase DDE domain
MALNIIDAVAAIKRNVAHQLSAQSIEQACQAENYCWRERELGPTKTVHSFLVQVLHGNTACSHTVRLANLDCSTEAYCQARARVPLSVYERLLKQTCVAARRRSSLPLWHGHRTFLIDGSSFSMPDTEQLRAYFGQSGAQQAGCGFPTASWLTLFDAESGLLVKQLAAPLRTHDMSQVAAFHPELAAGDVLVGDSAYASYAHLALLSQRNVHGVFRAHQRQLISFRQDRQLVGKLPQGTKAVQATSRLIRKLGKHDQIVEYTKPKSRPQWMNAEQYAALPDKLLVRELRYATKLKGGRTRTVKLVTTLWDPDKYPAAALAALYGQRWRIETYLSQLKTIMGMDVLRCKTVSGVLKEITIYALVYNLVRLTMIQAAAEKNISVPSVSFVDALRWLAQACWHSTPLRLNINPRRPNRQEPRVVKRRPKKYKLMNKPRCQLRQLL